MNEYFSSILIKRNFTDDILLRNGAIINRIKYQNSQSAKSDVKYHWLKVMILLKWYLFSRDKENENWWDWRWLISAAIRKIAQLDYANDFASQLLFYDFMIIFNTQPHTPRYNVRTYKSSLEREQGVAKSKKIYVKISLTSYFTSYCNYYFQNYIGITSCMYVRIKQGFLANPMTSTNVFRLKYFLYLFNQEKRNLFPT